MSRLCVDTSAYSRFKRGQSEACAALTSARWIGVPAIVLGELGTGFAMGSKAERNARELDEFLQADFVHVLDVDATAARFYAQLVVALRKRGTPVPTNDLWIASVAMREAATVLTYDAHFARMEQVAVRQLRSA